MRRPCIRVAYLAMTVIIASQAGGMSSTSPDPFASSPTVRVLLFVRTDCPLTNRYAPELQRIAAKFASRGVQFWLVYPDSAETRAGIQKHAVEYRLPGTPVADPRHSLVHRAEVNVAPQAAVFDSAGYLVYSGRIDDRYVEFGKMRPSPRTHDLETAISSVLSGRPVRPSRTRAIGCFLADVR